MNQGSLFLEGIDLLILGMGFVICFLALLILATTLMSKIASRYAVFPEPKKAKAKKIKQEVNSQLIAVISASINHHNKTKV